MQLAGSDPVKDTEMANLKQPLIVFNKKWIIMISLPIK